MKITLVDGTELEVQAIQGIEPARIHAIDLEGRAVVVKERDVRQIDPPLTTPLPILGN